MKLFDRIASVTFGPEGSENGLKVAGLRIVFNVTKTTDASTNTARVTIYNLSNDTHSKLKVGEVLILQAGYRDGNSPAPILALGTIRSVVREVRTPDRLSVIDLEDGLRELRQARTSVTYPEGASAVTVLQDAITALGLPAYPLPEITDREYVNGLAFAGPVKKLLGIVTKKLGLEWSVQTGKVLVVPKGSTGEVEAVLLKAQTGLVSYPERLQEQSQELSAQDDPKPSGWKVLSLLLPAVVPGGTIRIESETVTGDFRVEEVTHTGDTHGSNWTSNITARESSE